MKHSMGTWVDVERRNVTDASGRSNSYPHRVFNIFGGSSPGWLVKNSYPTLIQVGTAYASVASDYDLDTNLIVNPSNPLQGPTSEEEEVNFRTYVERLSRLRRGRVKIDTEMEVEVSARTNFRNKVPVTVYVLSNELVIDHRPLPIVVRTPKYPTPRNTLQFYSVIDTVDAETRDEIFNSWGLDEDL